MRGHDTTYCPLAAGTAPSDMTLTTFILLLMGAFVAWMAMKALMNR